MESYIVRIYRRGKGDRNKVAGQVEDVSDGEIHPFTSADSLGEFFAHKHMAAAARQPGAARGCRDDDQACFREPP